MKINPKTIIPVIIVTIVTTICLSSSLFNNYANTSALTYSNNTPVNFTFEPSISISLTSDSNASGSTSSTSADLIIEDLTPGSSSDSNIINIGVSTNNITGYTLSASAGNGTNYTNTNLVNTADMKNTDIFTSLSTNADISGINNIAPGYWGYSYSSDSGSTWSNYSGLPYYADTSGTNSNAKELVSSNTNGESTIQFKIGASANNTQIAGEYNNVINFYAITNLPPPYMQDATMSDCGKIMMDKRDTKIYTTALINGQCWMTQNLRTTGTISAEYSNFTGNDFNVSEYSLDANDATYANHCDSTNGYNYACAKDSGNTETGVWYNYYSATAGTISGNSNTDPATEDICPTNWHLPSGPNTVEGTDINKLIGNTIPDEQVSTPSFSTFNAVGGGYYSDGILYGYSHYGYWWSSMGEGQRYILLYYPRSNNVKGKYQGIRSFAFSVRCLMK